jgi:flagellar biosynthesis/type III secretory pathway protein FliH
MNLGVLYKITSPAVEVAPGNTTELMFGGALIPKATLESMSLAENVLREAQTAAAQLREQTAKVLQTQIVQAQAQAQAQGLAQGKAQGLASVLGTLEVERCLRELLSQRLAGIVEHCVRNLIGELGSAEFTRQRVMHLLRTASDSSARVSGATLYVNPEEVAQAQAIATSLSQTPTQNGDITTLNVVADANRAVDSLLLETKMGFIDSNLTLTLKEAEQLVQKALSYALGTMGSKA